MSRLAFILAVITACSATPPPELRARASSHKDGGAGAGGSGSLGDPGEDPIGQGCATSTAAAARSPVYMLIVLDGSGSMNDDMKWSSVVPALEAFFDDLASQKDATFGVGLTVFSDTKDATQGSGPYDAMQVPLRAVDAAQAAALHARLDGAAPSGNTPTLLALQGQYALLDGFAPQAPLPAGGRRVLVLMTDGVPDGGSTEQQQCVAAATTEAAKGTTTFAVGIGNLSPYDPASYDPVFMGALATAGGAPNQPCDPNEQSDPTKMCHFQVSPGGKSAQDLEHAFLAAINGIRGAALGCEFALAAGDNADPTKVNVIYVDGAGKEHLVPQSAGDGWTFDDPANPTSVILHGASCADVKGDAKASVKIVLGCKTVVK